MARGMGQFICQFSVVAGCGFGECMVELQKRAIWKNLGRSIWNRRIVKKTCKIKAKDERSACSDGK